MNNKNYYKLSLIIKDNNLYEKAYQLSLRMIKAYEYLSKEKKDFILSKQLLRSGTSIGANIAEEKGAISNADFSNKISLAYKESLETKYAFPVKRYRFYQ